MNFSIMAKTAEASMNVSALKLADQLVEEIIDNATHVTLYSFNPESHEWEKTNVEGPLFLYSRSGEPKYNIFILNRLCTYNLMEPITVGLDLQLKDPFLLYRNSKGHINGIWFLVREECVRIAQTVEKLVKEVSNDESKLNLVMHSCGFANQQAENNYRSPNKVLSNKNTEATQGVMDFFAKALGKTPSQPPPWSESNIQHPEDNPVLQKLKLMMSNPVKTVEQIEKQQRASTPVGVIPILRSKGNVKSDSHSALKGRPMSLNVAANQQVYKNQSDLENGLNLLQLSESPPGTSFTPTRPLQTQQFFNSRLLNSPKSLEPLQVRDLERSVTVSGKLPHSLEEKPKPALIPPVMFASSSSQDKPVIKPEPVNIEIKPEPLTKSQLLQAVSYLLKNDADFVNKLHEAYVKSFVDMVS